MCQRFAFGKSPKAPYWMRQGRKKLADSITDAVDTTVSTPLTDSSEAERRLQGFVPSCHRSGSYSYSATMAHDFDRSLHTQCFGDMRGVCSCAQSLLQKTQGHEGRRESMIPGPDKRKCRSTVPEKAGRTSRTL